MIFLVIGAAAAVMIFLEWRRTWKRIEEIDIEE